MKRFLIERMITNASGTQVFYCDAESEDEAIQKLRSGEGDIHSHECEVISLGEPILSVQRT